MHQQFASGWMYGRGAAMAVVILACLLPATEMYAQSDPVAIRDIEDFIATQGQSDTTSNECVQGGRDFLSWTSADGALEAAFDYAGLANEALAKGTPGLRIDTSHKGWVEARRLDDGRVEVSVVLHTRNALTCVARGIGNLGNTLIYGHSGEEIVRGARPALSDLTLKAVFITPVAADASLHSFAIPDLFQVLMMPAQGQEAIRVSIHAHGKGALRAGSGAPEGTQGRIETTQVILLQPAPAGDEGGSSAQADAPVERIDLRPVGQ